MIFEVRDGAFSYDKDGADLKDINFSVREPEVLAVLGANGVGKTTLLRAMLGLLPWNGGGTYIDGKNIKAVPRKQLWQKIGYVPQSRPASFVYTVSEMVLLGRSAHLSELALPGAEDRKIAAEAMESIGISHLKDKLCSKISGGEYQLVMIARALAARPLLLVLDEPESNLDFKNQAKVLRTISSLCKEKDIAAVINTHYPEHAMDISQKSLLLMPDKRGIFGETGAVLTESNLCRAFDIPVHIHKFRLAERDYACVLPIHRSGQTSGGTERLVIMETRIAQIGIIVESPSAVGKVNALLHEYRAYIIGRMGMPYREKNISIISVILDAPNDVISSLSGKLGMTEGVSAKTVYSKI